MIILLLLNFGGANTQIILKKTDSYPKSEKDYYFRPAIDLAIEGDILYTVINFEHKILKLKLDGELRFDKLIGTPGQGPGDLTQPQSLSIWNGKIAVKDNFGFSFFSLDGVFLNKFRVFTANRNFLYLNNKIYYINPLPDKPFLIEVYDTQGKKLYDFGTKFIDLNFNLFRGMSPFSVESYVFYANLLSDGQLIYYLNQMFGRLIIFSLDGVLQKQIDLLPLFGGKGKKILRENEKMWIQEGLDLYVKSSFKPYYLFIDACLGGDKIYLFGSEWTPGKKERDEYIIIKCLDKKSLLPCGDYLIKRDKDERFMAFAVKEKEDKPSFYVSMQSSREYVIARYDYK